MGQEYLEKAVHVKTSVTFGSVNLGCLTCRCQASVMSRHFTFQNARATFIMIPTRYHD
jgi:hypothetical protein